MKDADNIKFTNTLESQQLKSFQAVAPESENLCQRPMILCLEDPYPVFQRAVVLPNSNFFLLACPR